MSMQSNAISKQISAMLYILPISLALHLYVTKNSVPQFSAIYAKPNSIVE